MIQIKQSWIVAEVPLQGKASLPAFKNEIFKFSWNDLSVNINLHHDLFSSLGLRLFCFGGSSPKNGPKTWATMETPLCLLGSQLLAEAEVDFPKP